MQIVAQILVFREAKSKDNNGKVYENTKTAIKMFYNAGVLKTMKDPKILKSTGLSDNETISEALASTLAAQSWKAPTKSRNHDSNLPYPKWFKLFFRSPISNMRIKLFDSLIL